jgi:hypothetical protein
MRSETEGRLTPPHQNWDLSGKGEDEDERTVKMRKIAKGGRWDLESSLYMHCDLFLFSAIRKNKKLVHDSVRIVAFNCSCCNSELVMSWRGSNPVSYSSNKKKKPKILRIPCLFVHLFVFQNGLWNNGVLDGMRFGRGNGSTLRKPSPEPLYPSQIQHISIKDFTWAATLRNRWQTAWIKTRPLRADLSPLRSPPSASYQIFKEMFQNWFWTEADKRC